MSGEASIYVPSQGQAANIGNTVYMLYAHARICWIIKKSGKDIEDPKKIVEEACNNLLPNVLCKYQYNLSEIFTRFYTNCQVVGSAEETSRLLLCEATAVVMRKCFHLLGIAPVYKI